MKVLSPTPENIVLAAQAIREGRLVAMPTETVYGLAANAMDPDAVAHIFAAKGRPGNNPLIVHVASFESAKELVTAWPPEADLLALKFWPGPLTLVLPKRSGVPSITTAGRDTVAVRMPAHPVAKALIQAAGVPLAAPSANRFTALSPTDLGHLAPEIIEQVAFALDGGPCAVGIESTVVDLTAEPALLRPGGISRAQLEDALGKPLVQGDVRRSPGSHPRHYAPRARVELVSEASLEAWALVFAEPRSPRQIRMPKDAAGYAARLYRTLHDLDAAGADVVQIETPPGDWEAVWDRLRRATSG